MTSKIRENVKARLDAEELVRKEIAPLLPLLEAESEHFWRVLAELANDRLDKKVVKPETIDPLPPMEYEEAIEFEKLVIDFGKYKGDEVGELPISYILSITEDSWFIKKLKRYTKSKVFQARQDEGDE